MNTSRLLSRAAARATRSPLPRRAYATVHQDLPQGYNLPKATSPTFTRPPPKHHHTNRDLAAEAAADHTDKLRLRWMMGAGTIGVGALMYLIFNEPERTEGPVASRFDVASPVVMAEGSDPRLVNSGTSSVPPFPSVMRVENDEFLLVGLGIRTVSFISIQVYVVGFYVHRDDVEVLRKAVEKRVGGKEALRSALTDPVEGERVWEELLSGGAKFRSAFRIVPTRNTDFQHLRDGWVRGMQARTTKSAAYDDEEFVHALTQFKAMFGGAFKKSVPKQKTLLLLRNEEGRFTALYDPTGRNDGGFGGVKDEDKAQKLGDVVDPRIAKAMWLTYLAGPKPASPPAKESIVAGLAVA